MRVKNRDIPALALVLETLQEAKQLEQMRAWQKDRMYSLSQHLTGMPGARNPKGLDDVFAKLSGIETDCAEKVRKHADALEKAQAVLSGIGSQSMRTFVLMKYVMHASDAEIRRVLCMTRREVENARTRIESAKCMAEVSWRERYTLEQ